MERIQAERDRMLSFGGGTVILVAGITASVCSLLPGLLQQYPVSVSLLVLSMLLLASGISMRSRPSPIPVVIAITAAIFGIAVAWMSPPDIEGITVPVVALLGAGSAGASMPLGGDRRRWPVLGVAFVVVTGLAVSATCALDGDPVVVLTVCVGSWAACTGIAIWLSRVLPQAVQHVDGLADAYRVERQASEREAKRRRNARLLHDTVLATLTLLAHSGHGVSEGPLRLQAAEDAALLRGLRLGGVPQPAASGDYRLRTGQRPTPNNTLEIVRQRFERMGLEVSWHGTGRLPLPPDALHALLLALTECLENVRRHAGTAQAHVTITEDARAVHAVVTDSGIGFDPGAVPAARLGYAESVVSRIREVGGSVRLFSSPGLGTTVAIEVPKAVQ